jgi:Ca2+-binding RTX toxin-like protein
MMYAGTERRVATTTESEQSDSGITGLADGGWVVTWEYFDLDREAVDLYQQAFNVDGTPRGVESRINTYTAGHQWEAKTIALPNGGWLVTYSSQYQDGPSGYLSPGHGYAVCQKIFSADGKPVGNDRVVNTTTIGDQVFEDVALLANGGWVVTWRGGSANNGWDVYQRAYSANGTPVTNELRINTHQAEDQWDTHVTGLSGGGWVVTWSSYDQDSLYRTSVYQRIYSAAGTALSGEILVSTNPDKDGGSQTVTSLKDGGWVVTWSSAEPGSVGSIYYDLHQQAYNANGAPKGGESIVNTESHHTGFTNTIVALEGGGWVVLWVDYDNPLTDGKGIYQRVYSAAGAPLADEALVGIDIYSDADEFQVAVLNNGGWVVVWTAENKDGSGLGVYQQVYGANGMKTGGEIRVNSFTTGDQYNPAVTVLANGNWVVSWDSNGQDGSYHGVYQKVFALPTYGTSGHNTLTGGNGIDVIYGRAGKDRIDGRQGDDLLYGEDGNDTLIGSTGADKLDGGAGGDLMRGGLGNDIYYVDSTSDVVDEGTAGSDGTDTVSSSISFNLSATAALGAIERLILSGSSAINGYGNDLANSIAGNSASNTLSGGAGDDVLTGAAGADKLSGGTGFDTASYSNAPKGVVANLKYSSGNTNDAKGDVYSSVENLAGSAYSDTLKGNDGANRMSAASGNDILYGLLGNDLLIGGIGADTFVFDTKLQSSNIDTIDDFVASDDTICLDRSIFSRLGGAGDLAAQSFYAGTAAHDVSDRIIYDKVTGRLSYDADGTGNGAAVQFALLDKGLTLSAADFDIIA